MATAGKHAAAAATGSAGRARLFAWKTFSATFGGAVLTAIVALTQTWYSNHLEVLRRQGEGGLEYQRQLFALMGGAENSLRRLVNAVRRNDMNDAAAQLEGPLRAALDQWSNEVYLLRNRGAEIYGREVGTFIYSPSERAFRLDGCNVLVRGAGPGGEDCRQRQGDERAFVDRFRDRVMAGSDLSAFRTQPRSPVSYHVHLNMTVGLAERYLLCARAARAATVPPRCQDLDGLRALLNGRFDLLRTARLNVATAIMERSALRD